MAKNKITDLRDHLFETLEALKDPENPMELARARAISDVAQTIIDAARVEVEMVKTVWSNGISIFCLPEESGNCGEDRPNIRAAFGGAPARCEGTVMNEEERTAYLKRSPPFSCGRTPWRARSVILRRKSLSSGLCSRKHGESGVERRGQSADAFKAHRLQGRIDRHPLLVVIAEMWQMRKHPKDAGAAES